MTASSISSTLIFDEEMDRLMSLCSYISQLTSRIQLMQLSTSPISHQYARLYRQQLLTMSEYVEGSAVLLESLLAVEQRKSIPIESKKSRYYYTREELLKLRQRISPNLSIQIRNSLESVVQDMSNQSNKLDIKSWKNIRTILV